MTRQKRAWGYSQRKQGDEGYALHEGDEVIGHVKSAGAAEMICRAERELVRSAMLRAVDARQHRYQLNAMRTDIRILMLSLDNVAKVLKRGSRPREITAAREEVRKILKKMRARGYCL
jgi:hypothetical protein